MRPAALCISVRESTFLRANSSNICKYCVSFGPSKVRVRATESHQKPSINWRTLSRRSLSSFIGTPMLRKKILKRSHSLRSNEVMGPINPMSSTKTGIGNVKTSSDRAMLTTTSVKKILNVPGKPDVPKSPHTCMYRNIRESSVLAPSRTSNQTNMKYCQTHHARGNNG